MRLFLSAFFFISCISAIFPQDYNIMDYGAKPDGISINSVAIQSAIDAAHKNGGGRVVIPAGSFLSGSIILKSGVELHLQKDAVLMGSTYPDHYLKLNRWLALVLAD